MAKSSTRKASRKAGRKASRKAHKGGNANMVNKMGGNANMVKNMQMGGKASRKSKGLRIVQRVWSPFNHLLKATGNSAQRVGSTAGRIAKETVGLPAGIGRTFAKHSNMAVRNVFHRGGRKSRKSRKASRKASRKSSKSRKGRKAGRR